MSVVAGERRKDDLVALGPFAQARCRLRRARFDASGDGRKRRIEPGVLISRPGSHWLISEAFRSVALAAIARITADPVPSVSFVPVQRDTAALHVVGGIAACSWKAGVPPVEKLGATPWYAVPQLGFEASVHVVCTDACPIRAPPTPCHDGGWSS